MGIAERNNRQLLFEDNRSMSMLLDVFPKLEINLRHEKKIQEPIHLNEVRGLDVDERFFKLPNKSVKIGNYLQSFRYFENISSDLLSELSEINSSVESKVDDFINGVKEQASTKLSSKQLTTVCVHVRRSDYFTKSEVKLGRKTPSSEEIKFAMKFMEEKFKHVIFIVASDDKNWCAKHLLKANVFISNFTSYVDDFVLLQSCDHMIMTVGTFGWWAAWLTSQRGGIAMYYKDPFTVDSEMYNMYKRHNHYPEDWFAYDKNSVVKSRQLKD